jgi:signal peptidase I
VSEASPGPDRPDDAGYEGVTPVEVGPYGDPVGVPLRVTPNGHTPVGDPTARAADPIGGSMTATSIDPNAPVDPNDPNASVEEGMPGDVPPEQPPKKSSNAKLIREIVETVVMAILIFFAVRAVVQNFKVEGLSMSPTFYDGEFLLVNKAVYTRIDMSTVHKFLPFVSAGSDPEKYIFHGPQRGDVIVFHPPPSQGGDSKDFIKRVVGVPGDTVDVKGGHVYVNNRLVEEPYITQTTNCFEQQYCHLTLGPGQYYVLGDNRGNSSDSRFWGPASADKIIGKALFIYWCGGKQCSGGTDRIGFAPNHDTQLGPVATPTQ